MRTANVLVHNVLAGEFREIEQGSVYEFEYYSGYTGAPVSLTMPVKSRLFTFAAFPPFFEGLLPEGVMLEGLVRRLKIERNDLFSQLVATGGDLVGAVTVKLAEA
ncbi:MAG: HipA N-terminal domain-containing protein [Saprospiraceae bacterium]|jgi:serine/threonine-protein kinase HipA|nr:HipA N-terminal domain-containing protein [Saprospiraceae bacterium]